MLGVFQFDSVVRELTNVSIWFRFPDDIRELNGHADDEIKRQRLHYGSDQLYSVSTSLIKFIENDLLTNRNQNVIVC